MAGPDGQHHRRRGDAPVPARRPAPGAPGAPPELSPPTRGAPPPTRAAIRDARAWPGEEVVRTALPVVLARAGRGGGRRLILSGHVDVVPPGEPSTWTVDPWAGDVRDGRLYGRGACDMKGGVAAILGAVRALGAAGILDALAGELVV